MGLTALAFVFSANDGSNSSVGIDSGMTGTGGFAKSPINIVESEIIKY
jgi:hypothetical protein